MAITGITFPPKNVWANTTRVVAQCETNGTSAPDGAVPGDGVAWARTAAGVITATFDVGNRGDYLVTGRAYFLESDNNIEAKLISYVGTTGVATIHTTMPAVVPLTFSCVGHDTTPASQSDANAVWTVGATGVYTVTLAATYRYAHMHNAWVTIFGGAAEEHGKVISYNAGTGAITIHTFADNAGAETASDLVGETIIFTGLFSHAALPALPTSALASNRVLADTTDKTLVLELDVTDDRLCTLNQTA